MALVELDRRFLDVNASLCAMSGFSRDELLATSLAELTNAGNRGELAAQVRALLNDPAARAVAECGLHAQQRRRGERLDARDSPASFR